MSNSNGASDPGSNVGTTAELLRSYMGRLERLDEHKAEILEDIKTVYIEAKNSGFDPKIMRKVFARKRKGQAATSEEDQLIEAYEAAIGGTQLVLPIHADGEQTGAAA